MLTIYDASPPPSHAVVRTAGSVSVSMPEVATTASDGWPTVMRSGQRRWSVPVLLNQSASGRVAWLGVNGVRCPLVRLTPGQITRLSCTALVNPDSAVSVSQWTVDGVVATWRHTVR